MVHLMRLVKIENSKYVGTIRLTNDSAT